MKRILFLTIHAILFYVAMLSQDVAYASQNPQKPVYLIALHVQPGMVNSQFTFLLTQKTIGRLAFFSNPNRIVVELKNARAKFDIEDLPLKNSNVTAIESEVLPNNMLRFIFYTRVKARAQAIFSADQHLRIQIFSVANSGFHLGALKKLKRSITAVAIKPITIVVDAGHGGSDPGARGPHGRLEKDIVLAIAKRLAARLESQAKFRVVLTRTRDHYVPLRERLTLARKSKADIFVAIHADGYFKHNAEGASVYALSQRGATSEAARWLAQRENYSELGGVALNTLQDKSPILRKVLIDLAQTATIKASLTLGNDMLNALDDVAKLHHSRVEQAPFLVLKSPDIASILVETGFISNPTEENQLTNPFYQNRIADALYRGIVQYVKKMS